MSIHRYSTKSGDRWKYTFRPRPGGKPIIRGGFLSPESAETAEREHKAAVTAIKDPTRDTIGELLLNAIERYKAIDEDTKYQQAQSFRRWVIPHIGNLPSHRATDPNVYESLFRTLKTSGNRNGDPLSDGTVFKIRRDLKSTLRAAGIETAWMPKLKAPEPKIKRLAGSLMRSQEIWGPVEVAAFLSGTRCEKHFLLWYLAFTLGMRRGELVGLRWENVDLEARVLYIIEQHAESPVPGVKLRRKAPKSQSARPIPFGPAVAAELHKHRIAQVAEIEKAKLAGRKLHPEAGMIVFHQRLDLGPYSPESVSSIFRRAVKRLGLPRTVLHDGRHYTATMGVQNGVDIKSMQQILGHKDASMLLDVYAAATIAGVAAGTVKLEAALLDRLAAQRGDTGSGADGVKGGPGEPEGNLKTS